MDLFSPNDSSGTKCSRLENNLKKKSPKLIENKCFTHKKHNTILTSLVLLFGNRQDQNPLQSFGICIRCQGSLCLSVKIKYLSTRLSYKSLTDPYHNTTAKHLEMQVWTHKASLTSSLFIEVHVPKQETDQQEYRFCFCTIFFYWILELIRLYRICCFSFYSWNKRQRNILVNYDYLNYVVTIVTK